MRDQQQDDGQQPATGPGRGILHAPWERAFERVLSPFEEFIRSQTSGGLLLFAATVAALVLANSSLAEAYWQLVRLPVSIGIGSWRLEMSLHHWINDGLMAFFFFVVGLELKRELLVGELAEPRQAALPVMAALGGMVVPALAFLGFNAGGDAVHGWGIPMATDIAFAAGALVMLAGRVPRGLITFLVALAIVDDLGAVAVIALFYTGELVLPWLGGAVAVIAGLVVLNLAGVRRVLPYFLLAVVLWFTMLQSGVHATLAGVIGAFTVPARPRYDAAWFSAQLRRMAERFDASRAPGAGILANEEMHAAVQALENGAVAVQAPLQRLEHAWHLPVAFGVIPLFALFNAGIRLDPGTLGEIFRQPVALGVTVGLVLGKFVGVTGASWLGLRLGLAQLPAQTRMAQIAAVGLLAGIGFTMSIFIAELAYMEQPAYLLLAKTGIIAASLIAGLGGMGWLWLLGSATRGGKR